MKRAIVVSLVLLFLMLYGCIPQSDYEEISPDQSRTIGFIGCSNTRETVEGYHHVFRQ